MAPRRGEDAPTRVLSAESDLFVDEATSTLWHHSSPSRIDTLLGEKRKKSWIIEKLGLRRAFKREYDVPDWDMVKEFISHFDAKECKILFRGSDLAFNVDVLRDVFKLPKGTERTVFRWNGTELKDMFTKDKAKGGQYCLDWLTDEYKHWEAPLRVVNEFLLGKRRPSSCSGKLLWYFWKHLTEGGYRGSTGTSIRTEGKPDWAFLVHEELRQEILAVQRHLMKGPQLGAKKLPCFLGSAVMLILQFYGHRPAGNEEDRRPRKRVRYVGIPEPMGIPDPMEIPDQAGIPDLNMNVMEDNSVEDQAAALEKANSELKTALEQVTELTKQVTDLRKELTDLQKELTDLQRACTENGSEAEYEKSKRENAEKKYQEKTAELVKLKEHIEGLKGDLAKEKKKRIDATEFIRQEANQKVNALQGQLKEALEKVEALTASEKEATQAYVTANGLLEKQFDEAASMETIRRMQREEQEQLAGRPTMVAIEEGGSRVNVSNRTTNPSTAQGGGSRVNQINTTGNPSTSQGVNRNLGESSDRRTAPHRDRDSSSEDDSYIPEPPSRTPMVKSTQDERIDGSKLTQLAEVPRGQLTVIPKYHQKIGLAWMIGREAEDAQFCRGGILADDQGMGKTLQAITLILANRSPGNSTLVVCPVNVIKQWKDECLKMCSPSARMSVLEYHGTHRNTPGLDFSRYTVVVTSFQTLEMEAKTFEKKNTSLPYEYHWFRVILDECQMIKNSKSNVSGAMAKLQSSNRWCLSGTPLQNSVGDLYSIFRFLRHSDLWVEYRWKRLVDDCKKGNGMEQLKEYISHLTLRRMKDILDLPEKTTKIVYLDFASPDQRSLYDKYWSKSADLWQESRGDKTKTTGKALALLLKSRQACVHPTLTVGKPKLTANSMKWTKEQLSRLQDKVASLVVDNKCSVCKDPIHDNEAYISTTCAHLYCSDCYESCSTTTSQEPFDCRVSTCKKEATLISIEDFDEVTGLGNTDYGYASHEFPPDTKSTKIEAVIKYIKKLPPLIALSGNREPGNEGCTEKAIVFSQWTSALNLLQNRLIAESIAFERLDGTMDPGARFRALDNFKVNPQIQVMLLSLKAANAGLNIISANHVILLDLWWNPAVECQAVDRCHRIGQIRPVTVTKFIMKDTVEERIMALQEKKIAMYDCIFAPKTKRILDKPTGNKEANQTDMDYLLARFG